MGLEPSDLAKVPAGVGRRELYGKVVSWHRDYGSVAIRVEYGGEPDGRYPEGYLKLLSRLPADLVADEADIDYVFLQVLSGLMEWSYHQTDPAGVKMAAYATAGVQARYRKGYHDTDFHANAGRSFLNDQSV
jgi:hypothetical protein